MDRPPPLKDALFTRRVSVWKSGWYLVCEKPREYFDAIVMLHKGYNTNVSGGHIVAYSAQHENTTNDSFSIIKSSGSNAFKEIGIIAYNRKDYVAVRMELHDVDSSHTETISVTCLLNAIGGGIDSGFTYLDESDTSFEIAIRKTLSS